MEEISDNPTIKEILKITSEVKTGKKRPKYGRPKLSAADQQVEAEIAKVLRDRVTKKRKPGRPRKFLG